MLLRGHLLALWLGLLAGCSGVGPLFVEPGDRAEVTVRIEHQGLGVDPDGYWVQLDDRDSIHTTVGQVVTRTWTGLAAGPHLIRIAGVHSTCHAEGPLTTPVDLGLDRVTVTVTVRCSLAEFLQGQELLLSRSTGKGEEWLLASPDGLSVERILPAASRTGHFGTWSPDGQRVAFVIDSSEAGRPSVLLSTGTDGADTSVVAAGDYFGTMTWGGSGGLVFQGVLPSILTQARLFRYADDGAGLQLLPVWADQPAWSPDGSQLAVVNSSGGIDLADSDGNVRRNAVAAGRSPVWSPDGTRIASAADGIAVTSLADGAVVRLTSDAGEVPVGWSRDGSQLLFILYREDCDPSDSFDCWGHSDLYAIAVDPPHAVRQITWSGDVLGAWLRPLGPR